MENALRGSGPVCATMGNRSPFCLSLIHICAVGAELYENWTDVSGFLMTDPRIVDNPRTISMISYKELRELSYMGASVLHEDSIFPVRRRGIPIRVRNTNRPQDPGTLLVPHTDTDDQQTSLSLIHL